jgi:hypothetical protein
MRTDAPFPSRTAQSMRAPRKLPFLSRDPAKTPRSGAPLSCAHTARALAIVLHVDSIKVHSTKRSSAHTTPRMSVSSTLPGHISSNSSMVGAKYSFPYFAQFVFVVFVVAPRRREHINSQFPRTFAARLGDSCAAAEFAHVHVRIRPHDAADTDSIQSRVARKSCSPSPQRTHRASSSAHTRRGVEPRPPLRRSRVSRGSP